MGVFKHSPGCGCCGCEHCEAGFSDTVDLVIPSPSAVGGCTSCSDIGGTYTLSRMSHNGSAFDSQLYADRGINYQFDGGTVVCGWEHVITGTDDSCFDYPIYLAFAIANNNVGGAKFYYEIIDSASPSLGRFGGASGADATSVTPSDWNEDGDCTANLLFTPPVVDGSWSLWSCAPFASPPSTLGIGYDSGACDNVYCEWINGDAWELNP